MAVMSKQAVIHFKKENQQKNRVTVKPIFFKVRVRKKAN